MSPDEKTEPSDRDVALGAVDAGVRAAAAAARLASRRLRIVLVAPVVGPALQGGRERLAARGQAARETRAEQLGFATADLIDRTLAGRFPTALARGLAEHHVLERVATEPSPSTDVEPRPDPSDMRTAVRRTLDDPRLAELVSDVLASRLVADVADRVVQSPEFEHLVNRVASSPAIRSALANQTRSFGDELAAEFSQRTRRLDDAAERRARALARRHPASSPTPYAGLSTRAAAFAIDLTIASLLALLVAGFFALLSAFIGQLRPAWLVGILAAVGWALVIDAYLVLFWSTTGQTPGMRVMELRVVRSDGTRLGLGRSVVRVVGLMLAIIPLFAGFLPILVDGRRRGLPDFLAGTVVVSPEAAADEDAAAPEGPLPEVAAIGAPE